VAHRTLIRLESGERAPYMPTVTKIAGAYGVPVEELVEEE
jgi:transcriptional regulator with XRE-family HTH domain